MTLFLKSMLINWGVSIAAGAIAVLYFVQFSGIPSHLLPSLTWILATMMFFGFVIQGIFHFIWLEGEKELETWHLHPHKNMRIFIRVLRFPTRSALLAISLWVILGTVGASIFGYLYYLSPGSLLMLILITINCGGLSATSQMFFYRLLVFPRLEKVLRLASPTSEELKNIPVVLPIRGKLILISLFLVFLIFGMIFSAGYGKGRILLKNQIKEEIQELFLKMEEVHSKSSVHPESFWDTLWVAIGGPARIVNANGFIVVENKKISTEIQNLMKAGFDEEESSPEWIYLRVPGNTYTLEAWIPWRDFAGELREYIEFFTVSFFLGGIVLILISYSASREYSLSLRRFSLWIDGLSRGKFDNRPQIRDDDDLARLTIHLDRIRNSFSEQIFSMESTAIRIYDIMKKMGEYIELIFDRSYQEKEIARYIHQETGELSHLTEEQIKNLLTIGEDLGQIVDSARSADQRLERVETSSKHLKEILRDLKVEVTRRGQELRQNINPIFEILSRIDSFFQFFDEMEIILNSWKESNRHLLKILQETPLIIHSQIPLSLPISYTRAVKTVEHFLNELKDLEKLLTRVHELAEDTHLSSLNAAIRSTKVREIGRAFVVISDEVHQLANSLQSSLKMIHNTYSRFMNVLYVAKSALFPQSDATTNENEVPLSSLERYRTLIEEKIPSLRELDHFISESLRLLVNIRKEFYEIRSLILEFVQRYERIASLYEQYERRIDGIIQSLSSPGANLDLKAILISFEQLHEMGQNLEKFAREYFQEEIVMAKGVEELKQWIHKGVERMTSLREKLLALENFSRRFAETFVLFKV
jgi:methyl-accepting chemotaxis protein